MGDLDVATVQLSAVIESLLELGVMVHDFQGTETSRDGLAIKINQTISQLDAIKRLTNSSSTLRATSVPADVIHSYIELGRNPDVYTREFVEITRETNQHLRGKQLALNQLRNTLAESIKHEFPDLGPTVDGILKRTDL